MPPFILQTVLLPVLSVAAVVVLGLATTGESSQQRSLVTIPTLGVYNQDNKVFGGVSYVVVQVDHLEQPVGPELQFNEGSRALGPVRGSALSQDWKDAARIAALAASRAVGQDSRTWLVTLKYISTAYIIDGPSVGAALAVAMVAAERGVAILQGVAMTGAIDAEGHVLPVGEIPEKVRAGAAAGFSTILIPSGQTRTRDWDLRSLSESLGVTLIEVAALKDAYSRMTGQSL